MPAVESPPLLSVVAPDFPSLPFTASLDPDEVGVIRDAEGRAVCVVDAERELADVDVARLVWLICASANRLQPRAPAEIAWSALETIRAVLAPVGETSEAAMAALQVAEDALAELHGVVPNRGEG